MSWITSKEKEAQAKRAEILSQLSLLDSKIPRCMEVVISSSQEALAEVIDENGTTRGDILEKKKALRESLKS